MKKSPAHPHPNPANPMPPIAKSPPMGGCRFKHHRYPFYKSQSQALDKFSKGHLATDAIQFAKSKEVNKILFGCSRSTNLYNNGVLGLGTNKILLVTQSGYSKFSYCLGDLSDPYYEFNRLVIGGDKIKLRGAQTPVVEQNHYFINLEQIKIGGRLIDMDMETFTRMPKNYTGGVVVDTGATYTLFPLEALETWESEIDNVLDLQGFELEADDRMRLCYRGVLNTDLSWFPSVEFIFQGNAVMDLAVQNLFHQVADQKFCLAFEPTKTLLFSLLGNLIQQYYYVAFDLKAKKLAFQMMECSTIDDKIRHDEL
ncbi:hypothetical protein BUALT_Bualt16G0103600 [Buddleja alternifolia]|uniref:Peptidase A1 domain-containing protein n=1 Tax=Buddleja alternifolia TaxID=168488 RepID=A0AAV6WLD0_9LAMI|nr:hypothetical protein BUALT_Bualt16G0103600 [Buddleja alternifolia]